MTLAPCCAVPYHVYALGDVRTQICAQVTAISPYLPLFPSKPLRALCAQGVRCPMHSSGCDAYITPTDAPRLLSPSAATRYTELCERGEPPPGQHATASNPLTHPSSPLPYTLTLLPTPPLLSLIP